MELRRDLWSGVIVGFSFTLCAFGNAGEMEIPSGKASPTTPTLAASKEYVVRVQIWDDTQTNRVHPKAEIRLQGADPWRVADELGKSKMTFKDIGKLPAGKMAELHLYPDAKDGIDMKVPVCMTDKMNPEGSPRDAILININDDRVEVLGLPVEAATRKVKLVFRRWEEAKISFDETKMSPQEHDLLTSLYRAVGYEFGVEKGHLQRTTEEIRQYIAKQRSQHDGLFRETNQDITNMASTMLAAIGIERTKLQDIVRGYKRLLYAPRLIKLDDNQDQMSARDRANERSQKIREIKERMKEAEEGLKKCDALEQKAQQVKDAAAKVKRDEENSDLQPISCEITRSEPTITVDAHVGQSGVFDGPVKVRQIINAKEMLVTKGDTDEWFWLKGWPTSGMVTDEAFNAGSVSVTGTRTFTTVMGTSKTVWEVQPNEAQPDEGRKFAAGITRRQFATLIQLKMPVPQFLKYAKEIKEKHRTDYPVRLADFLSENGNLHRVVQLDTTSQPASTTMDWDEGSMPKDFEFMEGIIKKWEEDYPSKDGKEEERQRRLLKLLEPRARQMGQPGMPMRPSPGW